MQICSLNLRENKKVTIIIKSQKESISIKNRYDFTQNIEKKKKLKNYSQ